MWGMLGALACAAPWAWVPQEAADLAGYFAWQGSRPGPADIVVVTIDATSARNILLPEDPRRYHRCEALRFGAAVPGYRSAPPPRQLARWPRCLFSRALYALARGGARLVALDIQFSPRMAAGQDLAVSVFEAQDQELGAALASVGRSLIGQGVESSPGVLNPGPDGSEPIRERLAPLTPTVAAGSLGAAPFLIQQVCPRRGHGAQDA